MPGIQVLLLGYINSDFCNTSVSKRPNVQKMNKQSSFKTTPLSIETNILMVEYNQYNQARSMSKEVRYL
jgi:hypothetical protein